MNTQTFNNKPPTGGFSFGGKMADPFTSGSTLSGLVVVSGISLVSVLSGVDGNALIGAFAGAALFVVRGQDLSIPRRLLYFAISIIAGYLAAPDVTRLMPVRETGVAALIAAALTITVINKWLDGIVELSGKEFLQLLADWYTKWKGPKQ
nr:MAG TPA: holin [Caudoviricetes sp.]